MHAMCPHSHISLPDGIHLPAEPQSCIYTLTLRSAAVAFAVLNKAGPKSG